VTSAAAGYDSLDITQTRAITTTYTVTWYAYRNGQYVLLGSGTAADLNIIAADQNTVHAIVAIPSGQYYYVDFAKMQAMNSRITNVQFKDITGDGVKELVFTVDLTNIPYATSTGKYIMPTLNVYLLTFDGTTSASSTLTMNSAVSSIGTTQVTKFLQNYLTISAEKKAIAISKIVITANTSDISKVELLKQNVPNIGYVDGSSFSQNVQTSQIQWTYTINTVLFGADYVTRPVNTLNYFDFTTALKFSLASSDKILITVDVYYLTTTGTIAVLTGTVLCSA
jgi:hypothetical protein